MVFEFLESRTLLTAGDPINAFGDHGRVRMKLGDGADIQSLAVQSDGRVVVVGASQGDFFVARIRTDGKLDTTFGAGGKARTDFLGDNDDARAVAIQPDGKIVVVGSGASDPLHSRFVIARYRPDGRLDKS